MRFFSRLANRSTAKTFWDSQHRRKKTQQPKESDMPRMISIADAINMGHGETVPAFRAKIAKVGKQVTKPGADWHFQKITLKDGTGVIEAKCWNRDLFQESDVKREFIFECTDSQKGLTGMKRVDDTWKDKVTPQIDIAAAADISPVSGHTPNPTPAPAPAAPAQFRIPAPQQRQQAPAPRQTAPQPAGDWAEVNAVLNRQVNLRIRCEQASIRVADVIHAETGYSMEPDEIERRATAFYIELNRKLVTAPSTPPVWKKPAAPAPPAPAPLPPSQMTEPPDDFNPGMSPGELAAEGGEVDDVPF
jgi:hypothetical protein